MNSIETAFRREGLVRPADDRMLGGVCAGLGRRFGLPPTASRLLFVLILMVLPGSQFLIYPVLWILMPPEIPGSPPGLAQPMQHPPAQPYPQPYAQSYPPQSYPAQPYPPQQPGPPTS